MTAYFTGTFDPFTIGHLDILERGAIFFDRVVLLMLINPDKKTIFSVDERMKMLNAVSADFKNVEVDFFDGYAVDYVKSHGGGVLLRGVRNEEDLKYEKEMADYNFAHGVDTVFLLAKDKNCDVSSTKFKETNDLSLLPSGVFKVVKDLKN